MKFSSLKLKANFPKQYPLGTLKFPACKIDNTSRGVWHSQDRPQKSATEKKSCQHHPQCRFKREAIWKKKYCTLYCQRLLSLGRIRNQLTQQRASLKKCLSHYSAEGKKPSASYIYIYLHTHTHARIYTHHRRLKRRRRALHRARKRRRGRSRRIAGVAALSSSSSSSSSGGSTQHLSLSLPVIPCREGEAAALRCRERRGLIRRGGQHRYTYIYTYRVPAVARLYTHTWTARERLHLVRFWWTATTGEK